MTARQPPSHPTGLVAARRLPGKPPEEAATETDVTARRACFRRSRRGLTEQEVVLHVPLKSNNSSKAGGAAGGEAGKEAAGERKKKEKVFHDIWEKENEMNAVS